MLVQVGRVTIKFKCQKDERIIGSGNAWKAEYYSCYDDEWHMLGFYDSKEEAARALYTERSEFSAAYGA